MSVNNPPEPNVATFNNLYWNTQDVNLTQSAADLRYLKFPVAQGTENLQATNVNGILTANSNVNFTSTTPPTSSQTIPASTDNSTKIPTTSWVQSVISTIPIPTNLLTSNNSWTGTNAFTNTTTGSLTSSATQPASNDSSTKIPTTAWVQSTLTNLTPATINITATSAYAGFNCNVNNNAKLSFTGNTKLSNVNVSATTIGEGITFDFNIGGAAPTLATIMTYRLNFTKTDGTNWSQVSFDIDFYPNRFPSGNQGFVETYNIDNQILDNASYVIPTDPTRAPQGRMYWTYNQVFSGLAGTYGYGYLSFSNYKPTIWFALPDTGNWTYQCSVEALNITQPISAGYSVSVVFYS
jgi:hypothetical protein